MIIQQNDVLLSLLGGGYVTLTNSVVWYDNKGTSTRRLPINGNKQLEKEERKEG
jgi:hypothetical protein